MKYCPNCGAPAENEMRFCANCGKTLLYASTSAVAPSPQPATATPATAASPGAASEPAPEKRPVKWYTVVLWILFFPIMAILAVIQSKKLSGWAKALLLFLLAIVTFFYVLVNLAAISTCTGDRDDPQPNEQTSQPEEPTQQDNQQIYTQAKELYDAGKHFDALPLFEELGDYQDAKDYCDLIRQEQSDRYAEAVAAFDAEQYEEALAIFDELGSYEDAAERVSQCRQGIENRSAYEKARAAFDSGQFASAAETFKKLGDYKDSEEWLLKSIDEMKAQAEAFRDAGDYENALSTLKALQEYADCREQLEAVQETAYTRAVQLKDSGSYIEAKALFELIQGYKDSSAQISAMSTVVSIGQKILDISGGYYTDSEACAIAAVLVNVGLSSITNIQVALGENGRLYSMKASIQTECNAHGGKETKVVRIVTENHKPSDVVVQGIEVWMNGLHWESHLLKDPTLEYGLYVASCEFVLYEYGYVAYLDVSTGMVSKYDDRSTWASPNK